ncbi:hypothetical protein DEU56DRAFT_909035 [Suillus clintonianus]|uniref:uncharacterized protein n=1 Tax=Suillus clintonianus TaxID=1904413 RepID=UPI001B8691CE|nr:uncharacterized protein DEU56DRAFT_909035 [Suillus clintonianus]KAG2149345.1 hypothetical protein DEU56DRAFT_909035 [Suillus clintonianus]
MISIPDVVVIVIVASGLAAVCYSKGASPRNFWKFLRQKAAFVAGRGLPDFAQLTGFPHPNPVYGFSIAHARPRPYRPFRWEYHQTMSLKNLEPDYWIELESTYRDRIAQRRRLYALHGKHVIDELPGSQAASKELMEMVVQYLCLRYPQQFEIDEWTLTFRNHILGSTVNLKTVHPLIFLLENVPEDFLITQEDPGTGLYTLRAAVSTSAVGWNIGQKMGKPLHEIHGPVPYYKEKLAFSMDRQMPCNKPIQRGSWGLEIGEPLYLQTDEPEWSHRQHQNPDLPLSDIYIRVDWQTLRRLPKSSAIVFNFKALFTPVTDFRNEPFIPKLVLKVLLEGKKAIMEYKGTWSIEHKVIPALREWAKEQEDKGWVPKDWQEKTLNEAPFYPGWEKHYPTPT